MATSFLTLGLALQEIYEFDYRIPKRLSWLILVIVPLIIFLLGANDFVRVISIVGALGVGIAGIMEVITYWVARKKGNRKPEYVIPTWLGYIGGILIVVLFGLGVGYTMSIL